MTEEHLSGGRTFGAVRVADAVHRPAQPWTAAVHALLRHLEAVGFKGAPRVLGFDERGRERLTYLPGETVAEGLPWPPWVYADDTLSQVGAWLRGLHDVTARWTPPSDVTWFTGRPWRPGLVIGHHDIAPYNAVWRDGRLAGFVDWDTAAPSSRELDLAFAALSWVPLYARHVATERGFTAFDDRARRLHLLLDAYGFEGDRPAFGAAVAARARMNAAVIRRLAGTGEPIYTALLPTAVDYDSAAKETDDLPAAFWIR
jgi:hypothetical protein